MKLFLLTALAALSLSACAKKQEAAQETSPPIFYKEGVSDKKMTHDLNECANKAFKSSVESNNAIDATINGTPYKDCMSARGYEISYH